MDRRDAERLQIVHQRRRHRRTADDHFAQQRQAFVLRAQQIADRHPDRRYAGGDRDAFAFEQLDQAGGIQPLHRHDEVGADHQREERRAPGIDVEQRNDRQHAVALADPHRVGQADRQRVDVGRAMRVQHAFRVAGCRRGVAQQRRAALVELRPVVRLGLGGQEFFIAAAAGE